MQEQEQQKQPQALQVIDLGYANGWQEDPAVLVACRVARNAGEIHDTYGTKVGRCVTEICCMTCGYKYRVDSGG